MTWLAPGTRLWVLAPVAGGAAVSAVLQATEPGARLYATVALSLLAGIAGLLVSCLLARVSAQADRITRLVSDLRKLADLETQEIEAAPVNLPGLLHEVIEAVGEIPAARQRFIRMTVPRAPWPLPFIEGDRDLLFIAI